MLGEYDNFQEPDCQLDDPTDCAPPLRLYEVDYVVRNHNDYRIDLIRTTENVAFEGLRCCKSGFQNNRSKHFFQITSSLFACHWLRNSSTSIRQSIQLQVGIKMPKIPRELFRRKRFTLQVQPSVKLVKSIFQKTSYVIKQVVITLQIVRIPADQLELLFLLAGGGLYNLRSSSGPSNVVWLPWTSFLTLTGLGRTWLSRKQNHSENLNHRCGHEIWLPYQ